MLAFNTVLASTRKRTWVLGLYAASLGLLAACGGGSSSEPGGGETPDDCEPGTEGCSCRQDETCSGGLSCVAGGCIPAVAGTGGASPGSGGSSSTGGAAPGAECTGNPTVTCADALCDSIPGCEVSESATCSGDASKCSTEDGDTSACNALFGCEPGVPGFCYQYSTSCSNADAYDECEAKGGCSWQDFQCVGQTQDCNLISSAAACSADGNCQWEPSELLFCVGTSTSCDEMAPRDCERQAGCSVQAAECGGTPRPCAELSLAECRQVPGCRTSDGSTLGTTTPTGAAEDLPDLASDIFFASRWTDGDDPPVLQMRLSWINRGTADADAHTARVFLSEDKVIDSDDQELFAVDLTGMGPGGFYFYDTGVLNLDMETLGTDYGAGHYHVAVYLDATEEITEYDEENNLIFSELLYIGAEQFDVAVEGVSATEDSYAVADPAEISVDVTNHSTFDLPTVSLRYYLSEDTSLDGGDVAICDDETTAALAVGETLTVVSNCEMARARGDYYILAVADPDDVNGDANPADNVTATAEPISVSAPSPDFVASDLSSSSYALEFLDSVDLEVTVENIGPDPAADTSVGFYLSTDDLFDPTDLLICSAGIGEALASNASAVVSTSCAVPASAIGEYSLIAVVDRNDAVFEGDEENNTALAASTIDIAPPDFNLEAESISFSPLGPVTTDDQVNVEMTIGNFGSDATPAYDVHVYLSTDTNITTSDTLFCTSARPALAASTGATFAIGCIVPTVDPGTYYMGFVADPEDELPETDEADNTSFEPDNQLTIAE
jgi:subtilase family serine protease